MNVICNEVDISIGLIKAPAIPVWSRIEAERPGVGNKESRKNHKGELQSLGDQKLFVVNQDK